MKRRTWRSISSLLVLRRRAPARVRLRNLNRLILVWLYRLFPSLLDAITVAKSETVIRWHRCGFRAYRHWKCRRSEGRPRIDREIRELIRRMSRGDPLWGAPRIHGELLMLGIKVSESTVGGLCLRKTPSRVRFGAAGLINELVEAKHQLQLGRALSRWARYDLIALDEVGYVPLAEVGAEFLFQVIAEPAEKAAVIVTNQSAVLGTDPGHPECAAVQGAARSHHRSRAHH